MSKMRLQNTPRPACLFGLVDGACSASILPLLESAGTDFRSVFAGLPEEDLGPASLFLVRIDDTEADWVGELDRIDLHSPCLNLIWSRVGADELVAHLQAFLFADIGDGVTALVRYFDPRNVDVVVRIWGDQIRNMFMEPIDRWLYRGRQHDWQRIENDSLTGSRVYRSIMVQLEQPDIDALMAHTEPDELLTALIEQGLADGEPPYRGRMANFMPRYQRAVQWGFTEAADRLGYCEHTYRYGFDFDRHARVHEALATHRKTGQSFRSLIDQLPTFVWSELALKRTVAAGT